MKVIFDGKSCKAEYIADKQRVYFTFLGYPNLDEAKEMYLKVFECMKLNRVIGFLSDLREMKGTFTSMNDFLVDTFRPAVELGFRHSAMVLNNDIFTGFATNDLIKKSKIVQIQVFNSVENAQTWLDEKLIGLGNK
jgi:hypothetical protein